MTVLRTWFGGGSGAADPDPRYTDTHYLVKATHTERNAEWCQAATQSPFRYDLYDLRTVEWVQTSPGYSFEVGRLGDRDIVVGLQWAYLNGALVCFWEPESRLVDYDMIETWLRAKLPNVRTTANAANLRNVILEINRRDSGARRTYELPKLEDIFTGPLELSASERAYLLRAIADAYMTGARGYPSGENRLAFTQRLSAKLLALKCTHMVTPDGSRLVSPEEHADIIAAEGAP